MKHFLVFIFVLIFLRADAQQLIPYRGKNGWGYADTTGKIVIEPNASIKPFVGTVLINGRAVYSDVSGKEFDPGKPIPDFKLVVDKATGKKHYVFCGRWKTAELTCDKVMGHDGTQYWYFGSGYFVIGKFDQRGYLLQGVIDSTGKVIIPPYYYKIVPGEKFIRADSMGRAAQFDYHGNEIIPAFYEEVFWDKNNLFVCSDRLSYRKKRDIFSRTDFRDSAGKLILAIQGTYAGYYSDNIIASDSDSIRFYSTKGKWLFSVDTTLRALVKINGDFIQFAKGQYSPRNYYASGSLYYLYDENIVAYEIYNIKGEFIRQDSTDQQILLKNGSVLIRKPHDDLIFVTRFHYLLIDKNGNTLNDIEADTILQPWEESDELFFEFYIDDRKGWISGYDGHVMTPAIYSDYIWTYIPAVDDFAMSHSYIVGKENFAAGVRGAYLLDTNGAVLAGPFLGIHIWNGHIYADRNDSMIFLDTKGHILGSVKGGFMAEVNAAGFFNRSFIEIYDAGSGIVRMSDKKLIFHCVGSDISTSGDLFFVEVFYETAMDVYFQLQWYVDKNGRSYIDPELLKTISK